MLLGYERNRMEDPYEFMERLFEEIDKECKNANTKNNIINELTGTYEQTNQCKRCNSLKQCNNTEFRFINISIPLPFDKTLNFLINQHLNSSLAISSQCKCGSTNTAIKNKIVLYPRYLNLHLNRKIGESNFHIKEIQDCKIGESYSLIGVINHSGAHVFTYAF
jgi:hypothetical protein